MKKLLTLLLLLSSMVLAQSYYTAEYSTHGVRCKIIHNDTTYYARDTISIKLVIENIADSKLYIFEPFDLDIQAKNQEIYIIYGGVLNTSLEAICKLKLLEEKEIFNIDLKIPIDKIDISLPYSFNRFAFAVDLGVIKYVPELEYLSKGEDKFVHFKNYTDLSKTIDLHNEYWIGYTPIIIKGESGKN